MRRGEESDMIKCPDGQTCTSETAYSDSCVVYYGDDCHPPCHLNGCFVSIEEAEFCTSWLCKAETANAINLGIAISLGLLVAVVGLIGVGWWRKARRRSKISKYKC